jgi:hypothetical protein
MTSPGELRELAELLLAWRQKPAWTGSGCGPAPCRTN